MQIRQLFSNIRSYITRGRLFGLEKGLALTAVLLLLIAGALYVPATIYVSSTIGSGQLPIYCVKREDKKIALSFDTAWGNEATAELLEILEKYGVRASFFVTGSFVEAYPDEVKTISAAGHDIGNHSSTHPKMSGLSEEKVKQELLAVHEKVKELTGQDMILFRPPYGDYNNRVLSAAKEYGYYCIAWDVDSLDWKDYGTEAVIQAVTENKNLGNGSIILMHTGAKYTNDALETILLTLQDAGYEFVPVSELIYRDTYHIDQTGRQIADS